MLYKESKSYIKPKTVELNIDTAYLRKDIIESTELVGDTTVTIYTYQEAALTLEEYAEYTNQIMAENALKGQNDSSNIASLMSGQLLNDDNQITIMSALADIYETLLTNSTGGV